MENIYSFEFLPKERSDRPKSVVEIHVKQSQCTETKRPWLPCLSSNFPLWESYLVKHPIEKYFQFSDRHEVNCFPWPRTISTYETCRKRGRPSKASCKHLRAPLARQENIFRITFISTQEANSNSQFQNSLQILPTLVSFGGEGGTFSCLSSA